MRKFLISAAVATIALTAAVPAAAQYAPPYGNAYGYNNYGQVRSLQVRIDHLQRQIRRLDQRNILSNREAARLMAESRDLERRLARASRNGNRWGDRRYGDRDWNDRDRDGRNDRYEDDRGHDHD
jgi:opacity protein-like surface antigen